MTRGGDADFSSAAACDTLPLLVDRPTTVTGVSCGVALLLLLLALLDVGVGLEEVATLRFDVSGVRTDVADGTGDATDGAEGSTGPTEETEAAEAEAAAALPLPLVLFVGLVGVGCADEDVAAATIATPRSSSSVAADFGTRIYRRFGAYTMTSALRTVSFSYPSYH